MKHKFSKFSKKGKKPVNGKATSNVHNHESIEPDVEKSSSNSITPRPVTRQFAKGLRKRQVTEVTVNSNMKEVATADKEALNFSVVDEELSSSVGVESSSHPGDVTISDVDVPDLSCSVDGCFHNASKIPSTDCYLSLDCEGVSIKGQPNALGRCSIVDSSGRIKLDEYVRHKNPKLDSKLWVGKHAKGKDKALPFVYVRSLAQQLLKNKLLIGHSVKGDLKLLDLVHPVRAIRDTCYCPPLRRLAGIQRGKLPSLSRLSEKLLGRKIQQREHCSVDDAQAAMDLYMIVRREWELKLLTTNVTTFESSSVSPVASKSWAYGVNNEIRNTPRKWWDSTETVCSAQALRSSASSEPSANQKTPPRVTDTVPSAHEAVAFTSFSSSSDPPTVTCSASTRSGLFPPNKKKQPKDKAEQNEGSAELPHSPSGGPGENRAVTSTRHTGGSPGQSRWGSPPPSLDPLNASGGAGLDEAALASSSGSSLHVPVTSMKRTLCDRTPPCCNTRKQRHEMNTAQRASTAGYSRQGLLRSQAVAAQNTETNRPCPVPQTRRTGNDTDNELLDRWFETRLKEKRGFVIKKMGEDSACLFRSVADQVFGDQEMHSTVRHNCCDYMAKNGDFFKQYVTEDFNLYLTRKRTDHCHGNHIEIQAMSELYNRPVEVYQARWSDQCHKPLHTYVGDYNTDSYKAPIRISYHQNIHYNSVIDPYKATAGVGLGLSGFQPGTHSSSCASCCTSAEGSSTACKATAGGGASWWDSTETVRSAQSPRSSASSDPSANQRTPPRVTDTVTPAHEDVAFTSFPSSSDSSPVTRSASNRPDDAQLTPCTSSSGLLDTQSEGGARRDERGTSVATVILPEMYCLSDYEDEIEEDYVTRYYNS